MGQESLDELELNTIDGELLMQRIAGELLMQRIAGELLEIRECLKLSVEQIADKVGIDRNKLLAVEAGKMDLKWSEYLSLLFLFWRNDTIYHQRNGKLDKKKIRVLKYTLVS
ncbi:MAG: helix-turn-helix transcriptional regulator [Lachnospiraceae bacterium]|nr:helix-turn-helix transcriptional regulator [Lachnospiraceae bacterium]